MVIYLESGMYSVFLLSYTKTLHISKLEFSVFALHQIMSMSARLPSIAVLIPGQLRFLNSFVNSTLDRLLDKADAFDGFVSTDETSLRCLRGMRLPYITWAEVTPNTSTLAADVGIPLSTPRGEWAVLIQFQRLRHAWRGMAEHEARRGERYTTVVKLRTDLRGLPVPLPLHALTQRRGAGSTAGVGAAPELLVWLRGDWFFWGERRAMERMVNLVATTLPALCARTAQVGDDAYWPLPWRQLLQVGENRLSGQYWSWLRYPKHTPQRPFGFTEVHLRSAPAMITRLKESVDALEEMDRSDNVPRRASDTLTHQPFNTNRYAKSGVMHTPSPEKMILYHVLSRELVPLDAYEALAAVARKRGTPMVGKMSMLVGSNKQRQATGALECSDKGSGRGVAQTRAQVAPLVS